MVEKYISIKLFFFQLLVYYSSVYKRYFNINLFNIAISLRELFENNYLKDN